MPFGYGYGNPVDALLGSPFSIAGIAIIGVLYWLITLVAYLFTPVEEKRLDLEGEQVLDSLRTWSLRAKQTAILTNLKLYQSGVFRYGKSRRANVVPLGSIDSIQISSGRNYIWLAISIATLIAVLYGNSYGRSSGSVTVMLLLSALFFGIFWISGSRQITVRSKTTSITVDASIMNMDLLSGLSAGGASPVSDTRIFAFANRIQNLIVNSHHGQFTASPNTPQSLPNTAKCSACGARLTAGSQFCEECGQPVAATT